MIRTEVETCREICSSLCKIKDLKENVQQDDDFQQKIYILSIVSGTDNKCIEGVMFAGWGSHTDHTAAAYLTAAAAIGMTQLDLERFIKRLEKVRQ